VKFKFALKSSAAAAILAVAPVVSSGTAKAGNWAGANDNGIIMSGQIIRSLLYLDDGENSHLFHVDGSSAASRLRWIITGKLTESIDVGGLIEMNIPGSNPASRANFNDSTGPRDESFSTSSGSGDSTWGIRHTKVDFKHKAFGILSIGQSSVSSDDAFEKHLGHLVHFDVGTCDYGCGTQFTNSATGAVTGVTLGAAGTSYDGGRDDRVRYDTPNFSGFSASASLIDGGTWDAALNFAGVFSSVQVAAVGGYRHQAEESTTIKAIYGGSIAAKHDSGLNASFGWTTEDSKSTQSFNGEHWHVAVGYEANLTDLGLTSFTVIYGENEDTRAQGDESDAMEIGVNQVLPAGIDVFAVYSNFSYDDTTATNYNDISMFIAGTRLQF